jgi:hypothetical protein
MESVGAGGRASQLQPIFRAHALLHISEIRLPVPVLVHVGFYAELVGL